MYGPEIFATAPRECPSPQLLLFNLLPWSIHDIDSPKKGSVGSSLSTQERWWQSSISRTQSHLEIAIWKKESIVSKVGANLDTPGSHFMRRWGRRHPVRIVTGSSGEHEFLLSSSELTNEMGRKFLHLSLSVSYRISTIIPIIHIHYITERNPIVSIVLASILLYQIPLIFRSAIAAASRVYVSV